MRYDIILDRDWELLVWRLIFAVPRCFQNSAFFLLNMQRRLLRELLPFPERTLAIGVRQYLLMKSSYPEKRASRMFFDWSMIYFYL
ncbi:hypothetical protein A0U91_15235 (plasmid) [Acetobacter persici]|uniref:Uncharacterized protein n=1 Tax=Acetobacter persici TaxID=1076596 RepID=A0A1U9LIY3_9PROT|nr:hypothetical protein A0U91_15235 [Acetobacter persici]